MAATVLLSLEEYERLPDDGNRYEVDEGELVALTWPKNQHTRIQWKLLELLQQCIKNLRIEGNVRAEAPYQLSRAPFTLRAPDVSFIRAARLAGVPDDSYVEGAPDLAVEIVSPSDSAEALGRKVDQYLATGAVSVWVIYPKRRKVEVHQPGKSPVVLNDSTRLEAPALFPGWSVPVSDLLD